MTGGGSGAEGGTEGEKEEEEEEEDGGGRHAWKKGPLMPAGQRAESANMDACFLFVPQPGPRYGAMELWIYGSMDACFLRSSARPTIP